MAAGRGRGRLHNWRWGFGMSGDCLFIRNVNVCERGAAEWAYLGGRVDKGPFIRRSVLVILWCSSGRFGVLVWTRDDGRLLREACTILGNVDFSEKCVRVLKITIGVAASTRHTF